MWEFMKKNPLRPVCQMQPTHEAIKELEKYRRYVLDSIECYYKQILEELGNTDPETLEKLTEVLNSYQEVEASIDAKIKLMEEKYTAALESIGITLKFDYTGHGDRQLTISTERNEIVYG